MHKKPSVARKGPQGTPSLLEMQQKSERKVHLLFLVRPASLVFRIDMFCTFCVNREISPARGITNINKKRDHRPV